MHLAGPAMSVSSYSRGSPSPRWAVSPFVLSPSKDAPWVPPESLVFSLLPRQAQSALSYDVPLHL
jgi:hypothetical protein